MKHFPSLILGALVLAGCSDPTQPVMRAEMRLVGNNYYMKGDQNCFAVREYIGESRALCHRQDGTPTEVRAAMTPQQIQMWRYNQQLAAQRQAQARADRAALLAQMNQVSTSIAQTTPSYAPPPTPYVAPLQLNRPNVIHCTTVSGGFLTTCR